MTPARKKFITAFILLTGLVLYLFVFSRSPNRFIPAPPGSEARFVADIHRDISLPPAANLPLRQIRDNATLSIAQGYTPPKIQNFICSWRRHASQTHLHIFVARAELQEFVDFYLGGVCDGENLFFHEIDTVVYRIDLKLPALNRYFIYRDFITRQRPDYSYILIADARDSVFQGNPFQNAYFTPTTPLSTIIASMENGYFGESALETHANDEWIALAFGVDVQMQLLGKAVSCSDLTMGDSQGMVQYLTLMTASYQPSHRGNYGVDQGVHNFVVYLKAHSVNLTVLMPPFTFSPIFTMGFVISHASRKPVTYEMKDGLIVRTFNGTTTIPLICHQYDRDRSMLEKVNRIYSRH